MIEMAETPTTILAAFVPGPEEGATSILAQRGTCADHFIFGSRTGTIEFSTTTNSQLVDGTGWIPVDLTGLAGGSPLVTYPIDPINEGRHIYVYACSVSPLGFALVANLESTAYSGEINIEGEDGGRCTDLYETGTIRPYIQSFVLEDPAVFGVSGCAGNMFPAT